MKKIDAAAEDASLMIGLDAEPLPCMRAAEAPLQLEEDVVVHAEPLLKIRPIRQEHEARLA
jgi:hypothetical protein